MSKIDTKSEVGDEIEEIEEIEDIEDDSWSDTDSNISAPNSDFEDEELVDSVNNNAEDGEEYIVVSPQDRITDAFVTRYERVRMLSERAAQLARGAKPMIKGVENIRHNDREKIIAALEFEAKTLPMIISRRLPDGKHEHWCLSELEYKKSMIVYGSEVFNTDGSVNAAKLSEKIQSSERGVDNL